MPQEKLSVTFFYFLEKAIRDYRQYAQRNIRAGFGDITLDQLLVLRMIQDQPELSLHQIAEAVFKDYASITRIVDLLVRKGLLFRLGNDRNRRESELTVSPAGDDLLVAIQPIVAKNRFIALQGISQEEIEIAKSVLAKIIENCNEKSNG